MPGLTKDQFKSQVGFELGSPEATAALVESSKKLLPTAEEVYKPFNAPAVKSEADEAINKGIELYKTTPTAPIDEGAIRRDTLARFQAEVDATNAVYAEKLREAKVAGLGRLGSSNAVSARSGTLGSDFSQAQNEKVLGGNASIENSIQQEKLAKISAIFGLADKTASEEIAAKRKAQTEGLDSYLKFLGAKTERKTAGIKNVANALITQKLNPKEIDPAELQKIADSLGVTVSELTAAYESEKKTADQAAEDRLIKNAKDSRIELGEGQSLYELQADGSYKFMGKNPKTFAPGAGGGSKISRNEAAKLGLPLTLVDTPETTIYAQLESSDIPNWFVEKANKEANQTLAPDMLSKLWEEARVEIKRKAETESTDVMAEIEALAASLAASAEEK